MRNSVGTYCGLGLATQTQADKKACGLTTGHFVRIAPNEVSVSHPDGIKKILLMPLRKVSKPRGMLSISPHSDISPVPLTA